MAIYMQYKMQKASGKIYGASWDGSSSTAWTRTDDAALLADPNPAVNNGTGSSPFDNIMPWKGMIRVSDADVGELVAIPKFYFKLDYANQTNPRGLKIQISSVQYSGFQCSPAHMDRGDGQGERDVIYVGRYHCASGTTDKYKSKTGVIPCNNETRATFRSGIHNLGTKIWQWDYATLLTIQMLYLVEYADWNSQDKIGYGCCTTDGSFDNSGLTDNMLYHTGTNAVSRTTYGSVQYRNIEGLWHNVMDWVDGIRCVPNSKSVYIILNPTNFSDGSNGTNIGTWERNNSTDGTISNYFVSSNGMFYPSNVNGFNYDSYSCDYASAATGTNIKCGSAHLQNKSYGLFSFNSNSNSNDTTANTGSRLMKL